MPGLSAKERSNWSLVQRKEHGQGDFQQRHGRQEMGGKPACGKRVMPPLAAVLDVALALTVAVAMPSEDALVLALAAALAMIPQ
jgi:hypothetical protein